jgi:hypothetical protein
MSLKLLEPSPDGGGSEKGEEPKMCSSSDSTENGGAAHGGSARLLLDRTAGRAAGAGTEGQVSPEEDLATLFHQHSNSAPGFQPGL